MRIIFLALTLFVILPPISASAQTSGVHDSLERWTHASGATVLLAQRHDFPYVAFDITLKSGAAHDPKGRAGLAGFTAKLMTRGAGGRARAEIDSALDSLGTEREVSVGHSGLAFEGD